MRRRVRWGLVLAGCGPPPGPVGHVLGARELGWVAQSAAISGRDGAASGLLWGQSLWAFGDTFLAVSNASGDRFVSNTVATSAGEVDGGLSLRDLLDDAGAPASLLAPTADELAFDLAHRQFPDGGCAAAPCGSRFATWPSALVFDGDAGAGLIFYGLESAAPGDFNFQGLGQSVAEWSSLGSPPTRPKPGVCPESPTLLFCGGEPDFGAAAVAVGSDLFAFGCQPAGLRFACALGQVPLSAVATRSAWRFWTGSAWSPELARGAPLFTAGSILSVLFSARLGQWVVVYSAPLSSEVVYRSAPALTGPWSGEGHLFTADPGDGGGWVYDARPHPELSDPAGTTWWVTYSRSTGPFRSGVVLVEVSVE